MRCKNVGLVPFHSVVLRGLYPRAILTPIIAIENI